MKKTTFFMLITSVLILSGCTAVSNQASDSSQTDANQEEKTDKTTSNQENTGDEELKLEINGKIIYLVDEGEKSYWPIYKSVFIKKDGIDEKILDIKYAENVGDRIEITETTNNDIVILKTDTGEGGPHLIDYYININNNDFIIIDKTTSVVTDRRNNESIILQNSTTTNCIGKPIAPKNEDQKFIEYELEESSYAITHGIKLNNKTVVNLGDKKVNCVQDYPAMGNNWWAEGGKKFIGVDSNINKVYFRSYGSGINDDNTWDTNYVLDITNQTIKEANSNDEIVTIVDDE